MGIAALNPRLNMDNPLRGYIAFPLCMCCGRPSSRPYSYAVERCGDLQCIINDCPYMQCRGEWKLARVAPAGADTCWMASPPGTDRVSAVHVLRVTFQSPLQLRGGYWRDFQCIINDCPCRQCRGEWKLARVVPADDVYVAASPEGMI